LDSAYVELLAILDGNWFNEWE